MQNQNNILESIKPLKYCYIFHFILYVLIFVLHFVLYKKLYWLNIIFIKIFLFSTYFGILFYLLPLIPIILIYFKHFKLKLFPAFKKLTFIFFILSIIIGLLTSIILCLNTIYSKTFCKECPLSYSLSNLNYTFKQYYGKKIENKYIKNKCNIKRCILYNKNINEIYAYTYLCNYNLNDQKNNNKKNEKFQRNLPNGTKLFSNTEFICKELDSSYRYISFNNNEYYKYLDLCFDLTNFFICKRFSKPINYYNIKSNELCPEENYLLLLYIILASVIITDIIISFFPWCIEYISFKRILILLNSNNINSISSTSTKKSTNNSNNNQENFKKEETIIIIIPNEKDKGKYYKNNKSKINKDSEVPELGKIKIHKDFENKINEKKIKNKNFIKPLISEESERNNFNNCKEDINQIQTTGINIENGKDNITNNIINIKIKSDKK
jgi:hypothetical protein